MTPLEMLEKNIREMEFEVAKAKVTHEKFSDCYVLRDHYWLMESI